MMHWEYGLYGGRLFGLFFYIIVIILAIIIIVRLMGWGTRQNKQSNNSALNILNERFAKGEIDEAEYEHKKAVILDSERSK